MAKKKTKKGKEKEQGAFGKFTLLTLTFLILFGITFILGYSLGIYLVG